MSLPRIVVSSILSLYPGWTNVTRTDRNSDRICALDSRRFDADYWRLVLSHIGVTKYAIWPRVPEQDPESQRSALFVAQMISFTPPSTREVGTLARFMFMPPPDTDARLSSCWFGLGRLWAPGLLTGVWKGECLVSSVPLFLFATFSRFVYLATPFLPILPVILVHPPCPSYIVPRLIHPHHASSHSLCRLIGMLACWMRTLCGPNSRSETEAFVRECTCNCILIMRSILKIISSSSMLIHSQQYKLSPCPTYAGTCDHRSKGQVPTSSCVKSPFFVALISSSVLFSSNIYDSRASHLLIAVYVTFLPCIILHSLSHYALSAPKCFLLPVLPIS